MYSRNVRNEIWLISVDDDSADRPRGEEDEEKEGEGEESDEEGGTSRPVAGNTERDGIQLTKKEVREARGRDDQYRI